MKRSPIEICLIMAISLLCGVIWQTTAVAATAPTFEFLGQFRSGLSVPTRIALDGKGGMYVADPRKSAIVKFNIYGEKVNTFEGLPITGSGVEVTADGSRVFVAGARQVSILDSATGDMVGALGAGVDGQGTGEFGYVSDIAIDSQDFVFVADQGDRQVKVYNAAGEFQYSFGGASYFVSMASLAIDSVSGLVYVADPSTKMRDPKIVVFDLSGTMLRAYHGATQLGPDPVSSFAGLTVDDKGRLYVFDAFRARLVVLSSSGAYLTHYQDRGFGEGQLVSPRDSAYDPTTGRLLIANGDSQIEIFGIDGAQNPVDANEPPGMPVPVSPIADSEVATATPQLEFENAVDPDGDTLTYDGRLYLDDALALEYVGQPESETMSYIQVGTGLVENARYQWQVRAFDGEGASGWTAAETFYVNAVEESPTAPELVKPLDDALVDGDSVLSWNESLDPDPFDTVDYVVEISSDPSFSSLAVTEDVDGVSVVLGEVEQYLNLVDGERYFWRVVARDNHHLLSEPSAAGTFVYDTTIIKVTANTPGAKVYMNGNLGYPGLPVGEAPVELRDVMPGAHSVVVERSGLEPFVGQVAPVYRENVEIYAAQIPAITPADLKARPLEAGGDKVAIGEPVAPFLADFDNDGLIDLLYGADSGSLSLAPGTVTDDKFAFGTPQPIELSGVISGLVPFVADWNNDGRKDLIAGASDGTIVFFSNIGTEATPAFGGGEVLTAGGEVLAVAGPAVPAIYDVDGDSDKDLLVGTGVGEVMLFRNQGEDAAPQFLPVGNIFALPDDLGSVSGQVAPFFVDWDGDGRRELLAATGEHLYVCERSAGDTFAAQAVLTVGDALLSTSNGNGGNGGNGAFSLGQSLRLFALDVDSSGGKDLIVGNAAGEVRLVASSGSDYVSSFKGALLDKVDQIVALISDPEVLDAMAVLEDYIAEGEYKMAKSQAHRIEKELTQGSEEANMVNELILLLQ